MNSSEAGQTAAAAGCCFSSSSATPRRAAAAPSRSASTTTTRPVPCTNRPASRGPANRTNTCITPCRELRYRPTDHAQRR